MEIYKFNIPSEETRYCIFDQELEDNPLILFHTTPLRNVESIIQNGFQFGPDLKSVSYAKRSSSCLAHRGTNVTEDHAVFVVEFKSLDQQGIVVNQPDIHVYKEEIQPIIIGYCIVPKDYVFR